MPAEPIIRRADAADVAGIVALLADDDLGRGREDTSPTGLPAYAAAFEILARDPNQLPAVLEIDGRIAGYFQLTFIPGLSRQGMWRGMIESVRIDKSLRGRKLGEAMMQWAIAECRKRGCGLIQLTTDKSRADAHRFYARLGFKATHEGMKLALR